MGYNFTADYEMHVTEASAVAMSLDLDRLRAELEADHNRLSLESTASGDLVASLLNMLYFEISDSHQNDIADRAGNITAVTTYTGYASTKLTTSVDIVLNWMASHGVAISMDCRGEDDAIWRYESALGETSLRNEDLMVIAKKEYTRLKAAEKLLAEYTAGIRR